MWHFYRGEDCAYFIKMVAIKLTFRNIKRPLVGRNNNQEFKSESHKIVPERHFTFDFTQFSF